MWRNDGTWGQINEHLRLQVRVSEVGKRDARAQVCAVWFGYGQMTFTRKSGHSRRVDNLGECLHDPKTPSNLYCRTEG